MLGLGLALGLGLGLGLGFDPSSPIVRELVLSLTRLSFPLVRFRHNHQDTIYLIKSLRFFSVVSLFVFMQFSFRSTHRSRKWQLLI